MRKNKTVANFLIGLAFLILLGIFISVYNINFKKIAEQEETISKLESELEKKDEKIEKLKTSLDNKDDTIFKLSSDIEEKQEYIILQKNNIAELEKIISDLKNELEYYDSLKQVNVEATAYTSECDGCIGITKTGYDVRETVFKDGMRVIATDPDIIPLYSVVVVEPERGEPFLGVSLDVGSDIQNHRIDVLVKTKDRAFQFGRQNAKITIIKEGKSG